MSDGHSEDVRRPVHLIYPSPGMFPARLLQDWTSIHVAGDPPPAVKPKKPALKQALDAQLPAAKLRLFCFDRTTGIPIPGVAIHVNTVFNVNDGVDKNLARAFNNTSYSRSDGVAILKLLAGHSYIITAACSGYHRFGDLGEYLLIQPRDGERLEQGIGMVPLRISVCVTLRELRPLEGPGILYDTYGQINPIHKAHHVDKMSVQPQKVSFLAHEGVKQTFLATTLMVSNVLRASGAIPQPAALANMALTRAGTAVPSSSAIPNHNQDLNPVNGQTQPALPQPQEDPAATSTAAGADSLTPLQRMLAGIHSSRGQVHAVHAELLSAMRDPSGSDSKAATNWMYSTDSDGHCYFYGPRLDAGKNKFVEPSDSIDVGPWQYFQKFHLERNVESPPRVMFGDAIDRPDSPTNRSKKASPNTSPSKPERPGSAKPQKARPASAGPARPHPGNITTTTTPTEAGSDIFTLRPAPAKATSTSTPTRAQLTAKRPSSARARTHTTITARVKPPPDGLLSRFEDLRTAHSTTDRLQGGMHDSEGVEHGKRRAMLDALMTRSLPPEKWMEVSKSVAGSRARASQSSRRHRVDARQAQDGGHEEDKEARRSWPTRSPSSPGYITHKTESGAHTAALQKDLADGFTELLPGNTTDATASTTLTTTRGVATSPAGNAPVWDEETARCRALMASMGAMPMDQEGIHNYMFPGTYDLTVTDEATPLIFYTYAPETQRADITQALDSVVKITVPDHNSISVLTTETDGSPGRVDEKRFTFPVQVYCRARPWLQILVYDSDTGEDIGAAFNLQYTVTMKDDMLGGRLGKSGFTGSARYTDVTGLSNEEVDTMAAQYITKKSQRSRLEGLWSKAEVQESERDSAAIDSSDGSSWRDRYEEALADDVDGMFVKQREGRLGELMPRLWVIPGATYSVIVRMEDPFVELSCRQTRVLGWEVQPLVFYATKKVKFLVGAREKFSKGPVTGLKVTCIVEHFELPPRPPTVRPEWCEPAAAYATRLINSLIDDVVQRKQPGFTERVAREMVAVTDDDGIATFMVPPGSRVKVICNIGDDYDQSVYTDVVKDLSKEEEQFLGVELQRLVSVKATVQHCVTGQLLPGFGIKMYDVSSRLPKGSLHARSCTSSRKATRQRLVESEAMADLRNSVSVEGLTPFWTGVTMEDGSIGVTQPDGSVAVDVPRLKAGTGIKVVVTSAASGYLLPEYYEPGSGSVLMVCHSEELCPTFLVPPQPRIKVRARDASTFEWVHGVQLTVFAQRTQPTFIPEGEDQTAPPPFPNKDESMMVQYDGNITTISGQGEGNGGRKDGDAHSSMHDRWQRQEEEQQQVLDVSVDEPALDSATTPAQQDQGHPSGDAGSGQAPVLDSAAGGVEGSDLNLVGSDGQQNQVPGTATGSAQLEGDVFMVQQDGEHDNNQGTHLNDADKEDSQREIASPYPPRRNVYWDGSEVPKGAGTLIHGSHTNHHHTDNALQGTATNRGREMLQNAVQQGLNDAVVQQQQQREGNGVANGQQGPLRQLQGNDGDGAAYQKNNYGRAAAYLSQQQLGTGGVWSGRAGRNGQSGILKSRARAGTGIQASDAGNRDALSLLSGGSSDEDDEDDDAGLDEWRPPAEWGDVWAELHTGHPDINPDGPGLQMEAGLQVTVLLQPCWPFVSRPQFKSITLDSWQDPAVIDFGLPRDDNAYMFWMERDKVLHTFHDEQGRPRLPHHPLARLQPHVLPDYLIGPRHDGMKMLRHADGAPRNRKRHASSHAAAGHQSRGNGNGVDDKDRGGQQGDELNDAQSGSRRRRKWHAAQSTSAGGGRGDRHGDGRGHDYSSRSGNEDGDGGSASDYDALYEEPSAIQFDEHGNFDDIREAAWAHLKMSNSQHMPLETTRLMTLLAKWGAFPHVRGPNCKGCTTGSGNTFMITRPSDDGVDEVFEERNNANERFKRTGYRSQQLAEGTLQLSAAWALPSMGPGGSRRCVTPPHMRPHASDKYARTRAINNKSESIYCDKPFFLWELPGGSAVHVVVHQELYHQLVTLLDKTAASVELMEHHLHKVHHYNSTRGCHGRFLVGHDNADDALGGLFVLDVSRAQPFGGVDFMLNQIGALWDFWAEQGGHGYGNAALPESTDPARSASRSRSGAGKGPLAGFMVVSGSAMLVMEDGMFQLYPAGGNGGWGAVLAQWWSENENGAADLDKTSFKIHTVLERALRLAEALAPVYICAGGLVERVATTRKKISRVLYQAQLWCMDKERPMQPVHTVELYPMPKLDRKAATKKGKNTFKAQQQQTSDGASKSAAGDQRSPASMAGSMTEAATAAAAAAASQAGTVGAVGGGGRSELSLDSTVQGVDIFDLLQAGIQDARVRLVDVFRELDTKGEKVLGGQQLMHLLHRFVPDASPGQVRYFQLILDVDGDDKISYKDLSQMFKASIKSGLEVHLDDDQGIVMLLQRIGLLCVVHQVTAKEMFDRYDINKDGHWDHVEQWRMIKDVFPGMTIQEQHSMFNALQELDVNSDNRVSWVEFNTAFVAGGVKACQDFGTARDPEDLQRMKDKIGGGLDMMTLMMDKAATDFKALRRVKRCGFPLLPILSQLSGSTRGCHRRLDLGHAKGISEKIDVKPLEKTMVKLQRSLEQIIGFEAAYGVCLTDVAQTRSPTRPLSPAPGGGGGALIAPPTDITSTTAVSSSSSKSKRNSSKNSRSKGSSSGRKNRQNYNNESMFMSVGGGDREDDGVRMSGVQIGRARTQQETRQQLLAAYGRTAGQQEYTKSGYVKGPGKVPRNARRQPSKSAGSSHTIQTLMDTAQHEAGVVQNDGTPSSPSLLARVVAGRADVDASERSGGSGHHPWTQEAIASARLAQVAWPEADGVQESLSFGDLQQQTHATQQRDVANATPQADQGTRGGGGGGWLLAEQLQDGSGESPHNHPDPAQGQNLLGPPHNPGRGGVNNQQVAGRARRRWDADANSGQRQGSNHAAGRLGQHRGSGNLGSSHDYNKGGAQRPVSAFAGPANGALPDRTLVSLRSMNTRPRSAAPLAAKNMALDATAGLGLYASLSRDSVPMLEGYPYTANEGVRTSTAAAAVSRGVSAGGGGGGGSIRMGGPAGFRSASVASILAQTDQGPSKNMGSQWH